MVIPQFRDHQIAKPLLLHPTSQIDTPGARGKARLSAPLPLDRACTTFSHGKVKGLITDSLSLFWAANVTGDQTTGKVCIRHVLSLMANAKRTLRLLEDGNSYLSEIVKGKVMKIERFVENARLGLRSMKSYTHLVTGYARSVVTIGLT